MNELIAFWNFIKEEFDENLIEEFSDGSLDTNVLSTDQLKKLSPAEIDQLFSQVVELYMDVSGTDSLGDVYECLQSFIKDEARIGRILGEEE